MKEKDPIFDIAKQKFKKLGARLKSVEEHLKERNFYNLELWTEADFRKYR